jgi:hypothetical protein
MEEDTKTTLKDRAVKIKNHLKTHKFAYAAGTVAVLAVALQQSNVRAFEKFLVEKGIDPKEYFLPEGDHASSES